MKNRIAKIGLAVVGASLAVAGNAFAEFTMPSLPTDDIYTAGGAVAALVAVVVVVKMAIRMLKGA